MNDISDIFQFLTFRGIFSQILLNYALTYEIDNSAMVRIMASCLFGTMPSPEATDQVYICININIYITMPLWHGTSL